MKKAGDWHKELSLPTNSTIAIATIPDIRRIQADALRHAAKHVFETPHDCGQCCDDLEAEADALDPKEKE